LRRRTRTVQPSNVEFLTHVNILQEISNCLQVKFLHKFVRQVLTALVTNKRSGRNVVVLYYTTVPPHEKFRTFERYITTLNVRNLKYRPRRRWVLTTFCYHIVVKDADVF
jgi:hypothetical protein